MRVRIIIEVDVVPGKEQHLAQALERQMDSKGSTTFRLLGVFPEGEQISKVRIEEIA